MNPNQTLLQGAHQSPSDQTPAPLSGPANTVKFKLTGVDPPSRVYIGRDDQLLINTMSALAGEIVIVNYRIMLPDGTISTNQQRILLPTAYNIPVAPPFFSASEGFLLSVGAYCLSATFRGQTFVRIGIVRAGQSLQNTAEMLLADYVTTNTPIGWPDGRIISSSEGPGNLKTTTVANPGAGLDWTYTGNANTRWKVRHINAQLVTSAAVANRNPRLLFFDSITGRLKLVPSTNDQAASLTEDYSIGPANVAGTVAALANVWSVGTEDVMRDTSQIQSSTANIQAADQWQNIHVLVEEWLKEA